MNRKNSFLISDVAYLLMLLLIFVCILFIVGSPDELQKNFIILAVVLMVVMITYFTTITAGLLMNILMIFGYSAYVILRAAYQGAAIDQNVYFWIIWSPCMTAASFLFARRAQLAEAEIKKNGEQLRRLSGVDAVTELKNVRGFEQECGVYMKISRRYSMDLVLIVWQFRYQRELVQMLGQEGLERLAVQISKIITGSLREEDAVFLLDNEPYLWGTLLFTNLEAARIVIDRVAGQLEQLDIKSLSGKHSLALEMRVGGAQYTEDVLLPFELLEKSKKNLEYDV